MKEYIASFHTHFSAMMSGKKLDAAGIRYSLEPIPRSLSSSCGTCIRFYADTWKEEWMDKDCDSIYEVISEADKAPEYRKLISFS